jgi:DNA-binding response OmpR family regulator
MEILLVEDNEGDALLFRVAVSETAPTASLLVVHDGEQALATLENKDFQPSLIILDLNLPRISGLSLLERWQGNAVPVVVFSSTQNNAERALVLKLGAREFVHKPADLDAFLGAVSGIIKRWEAAKR